MWCHKNILWYHLLFCDVIKLILLGMTFWFRKSMVSLIWFNDVVKSILKYHKMGMVFWYHEFHLVISLNRILISQNCFLKSLIRLYNATYSFILSVFTKGFCDIKKYIRWYHFFAPILWSHKMLLNAMEYE